MLNSETNAVAYFYTAFNYNYLEYGYTILAEYFNIGLTYRHEIDCLKNWLT